jgi:hypothetical protein
LFLDAAGVIFDLFTPVHLLILNGVRTTNSLVAGKVMTSRIENPEFDPLENDSIAKIVWTIVSFYGR